MKFHISTKILSIIICALIMSTIPKHSNAGLAEIVETFLAENAGLFNTVLGRKKIEEKKIDPDFPRNATEFKKETIPYHNIPFNNPKYEFSIRIPKTWNAEAIISSKSNSNNAFNNLGQDIPYDIAIFRSPELKAYVTEIKIQAINLKHEISTENWLKKYVISSNYTTKKDVKTSKDKRKSKISFTHIIDGQDTYTTITAERNKDIILLLRLDTPVTIKKYTHPTDKLITESFGLTLKIDSPVEKQIVLPMGRSIKLTYPASWEDYNSNLKNVNATFVQINNYSKTTSNKRRYGDTSLVDGIIKVYAIKRREGITLEKITEKLKKEIKKSLEIKVKSLKSSKTAAAHKRFIFSRIETYKTLNLNKNKQNRDLHLAILGDKYWYIVAYLYTPNEDNDFYSWARNTESFRQIVKNLR